MTGWNYNYFEIVCEFDYPSTGIDTFVGVADVQK